MVERGSDESGYFNRRNATAKFMAWKSDTTAREREWKSIRSETTERRLIFADIRISIRSDSWKIVFDCRSCKVI